MTAPFAFSVALANEAATAQLMADLALLIAPGDVIALSGDLGAGKTAAARAMIRYLADDPELDVPSPTFTLVQSYELPSFPLLHADLYRIDDPVRARRDRAVAAAGRRGGADRVAGARAGSTAGRPHRRWRCTHRPALGVVGTRRRDHRPRQGGVVVERLAALRQFLDAAGESDATRQRMPGDASTRSYARLLRNGQSLILMNSPRRPDGAATYRGRSYSAAVHLAEDVRPFVAIAYGLHDRGYSAPEIHNADLAHGFLITEDFGGDKLRRRRCRRHRSPSATRPRPIVSPRCMARRCRSRCRCRAKRTTSFRSSISRRC